MTRVKVNYENETIRLYEPKTLGTLIRVDGFVFERYRLMNNNLDCGYRVYHNNKLIDIYQHYQKQSVTYDIAFISFEEYMRWLRKQVRNKRFL
jgi:hypothetical protein